jgi:hypothetical protein
VITRAVALQDVQYTGGHTQHGSGVCSDVSKVNPVCGKTCVNHKVMQSRDATFDIGHAQHEFGTCRKGRCSGTSRVNQVDRKMPV